MTTKIDGTLGITFPDATVQSTSAKSIGVGQTWQNLTASRANNTTYTNASGKPIMVSVYAYFANGQYMELQIDGVSVALAANSGVSGFVGGTVSGIVPNGISYQIVATAVSVVQRWSELR